MDPVELDYHRKNTAAFILVRPTVISLTPVLRVRSASGGFTEVDQPPRALQTFRIIELGASSTPPILRLTDGSQREAAFELLGAWNSMMAVGDHWYDAVTGREWRIGDVVIDNGYERRGLVTERGR